MKRLAMENLVRWKSAHKHKPLIVQGVHQVGKTWLMHHFADAHFPGRSHYLNFDMNAALFKTSRSTDAILEALAYYSQRRIEIGDLLIFDEAQACPEVIHALKYFCELRPDLYVLTAGSLLGLQLAQPQSFPVGKVEFMTLKPLNFSEFLMAQGDEQVVGFMRNVSAIEPIPELFAGRLSTKLKHYLTVGGMPEPAAAWCLRKDLEASRYAQKNILESYKLDIASHADAIDIPKIQRIWDSIPKQLSRENNQFRYSIVENRSNARKYGDALRWLIDARMVRSLHRLDGLGLPLSAYEDPSAFKIYFSDAGLLARLAEVPPEVRLNDEAGLFREMKGSITENFVLQSLVQQFSLIYYWACAKRQTEVDFVVQFAGRAIPIEVKASTNVRSPSLAFFKSRYGEKIPLRVRLSMQNLSLDGDLLNIPLYMADEASRLIGLALNHVKLS